MERIIGRKSKPFDQLSVISKRRRTLPLRKDFSTEELAFATEMSFKASGFLAASKVVKCLRENPESGADVLNSLQKQNKIKKYTNEESLALYLDMRLTKRKYDRMYRGAKSRSMDLYPSYTKIAETKKECYPLKEHINLSETGFSIRLQAILDLTANRLVKSQNATFDQSSLKLHMVTKWGFDGASSQSQYKQVFKNKDADDGSIFMTSLVPIILHLEGEPTDVYWQNMKPSSTTLCRPLRLEFRRETTEYAVQTADEINLEIENLRPTIISDTVGNSLEISHELICSMLDGKLTHALTETKSSQTCSICGATPSKMNCLSQIQQLSNKTEFYKYGMSTLHAWIRFLECVLHISYNLQFEKWSTRNQPAFKKLRKLRKQEIQKELWEKVGLKVDFVKQGSVMNLFSEVVFLKIVIL